MYGIAAGWSVNQAAILAECHARSIPLPCLVRPVAQLKCKKIRRIADLSYLPLEVQVLPRYRGLHDILSSDIGICSVHQNRKSNYLLQVRAFRGYASSVSASTSPAAAVPCSSESVILQDFRGDFNSWVVVDKVIKEGSETGQLKLIPLAGNIQQTCEMDPFLKDFRPRLNSQLRLASFCEQLQVHLSSPARSELLGQPLWSETSVAGELTQSQKTTSAMAAAEAIALAKAAVKAARDAAALAEAQTLAEADDLENVPLEADLLYTESTRHGEFHTLRFADILGDSQDPGRNLTGESSSKLDGFSNEASVQDCSTISMHIQPTKDKTIARSKRQLERKSKRDRALRKAKEVAAAIASSSVPRKAKKFIVSGYDPAGWLQSFLRESANTELLTATEEIELSQQVQDLLKLEKVKTGLQTQLGREPTLPEWAKAVGADPKSLQSRLHSGWECRDKMIKCNLRLVVFVAKTYQGQGMSLQDLLQEGSMGLIKGVENFDYKKSCRFSTYAYWKIRQALTRAILKHSRAMRLPAHIYELLSRIKEAKKSSHVLGRRPRVEEVAELVGLTVCKLKLIIKSTRTPKSIDQLAGKDQDRTLGEITADPHVEDPELTITKQLLRKDMEKLLRILTPRERKIIRLRYGLDDGITKTLDEIGKVFKVSRERIRQIECRALRKLKQPHRNKILREYLDVLN